MTSEIINKHEKISNVNRWMMRNLFWIVPLYFFILMGGIAYLPDIFNKFMAIYVEKFNAEINDI